MNGAFRQPLYNTAGRPDFLSIQAEPRVSFSGVSTRVFPLKASMSTLQDFCDNYLNFPDDPAEMKSSQTNFFRVPVPYVFFQMINYGNMAIVSENLGWFAQNEILFLVPLEWYKVDRNGQLCFHDWAMVCPFIFVDNDMSLTTGRETYGWSKVRGWLDWVPTSWTKDPRLPRRLLNMRTKVFTRLFAGEAPAPRTLIEVTQEQSAPLGPRLLAEKSVLNPVWNLSESLRSSVSLSGNLFEVLTNLPVMGYQRRDLASFGRMTLKALSNMRSMIPALGLSPPLAPGRSPHDFREKPPVPASLYYNQLTLKQFRDAAEPDYACYQALVNSRISVDRYYDFGALGGQNLLLGDLSGGFTIKVHDYPEEQIIETLGLEVAERTTSADNVPIATLKPTMPFWMNCDLKYDTGETLAWRGKASRRWNATGDPLATGGNRFNTTRGAALQEVSGPFNHPNATVRVFPLLADPDMLQKYCDDYLNRLDQPPHISLDGNSFEPWGSYVYMTVTTYGNEDGGNKSWADKENIGQIAERDIAFCVPVKWIRVAADGAQLKSLAVLTPYVFGSSSRHVITEREINGRPMTFSDIVSDDDSWLRSSGPMRSRSLARLRTLLIPALDIGQPAQLRDLIEITEKQPASYRDDVAWAVIRAKWEPVLERDRKNKIEAARLASGVWRDAVKLFHDFCPGDDSLNFLSLKQYRGTESARNACYQALVLLRKRINAIHWVSEIRKRRNHELHVLIHRYATMPIVETLGLKVKATDSSGSSVIDYLEPVRPFFMRVSLREELGQKVCFRINSMDWLPGIDTDEPQPCMDEAMCELIDHISEPQVIIEELLDREFGDGSKDSNHDGRKRIRPEPNFGADQNAEIRRVNEKGDYSDDGAPVSR